MEANNHSHVFIWMLITILFFVVNDLKQKIKKLEKETIKIELKSDYFEEHPEERNEVESIIEDFLKKRNKNIVTK